MDGDGFRLAQARVAIVGLGLMGGSLALALKGKCAQLLGVDLDAATRQLALEHGMVSSAEADPAQILPLVDILILAVPVPAILALLRELPRLAPQPCIVLDLGSTKRAIVEAMSGLPERFDPLGGHPLCGRERLSIENADGALYAGATFFLVPLERTSARAQAGAAQILQAIGARAMIVDAAAHDVALAATSHMPYLLSSALALATPAEADDFVGTGFQSTARLAGTPQSMMLGVLQSNRANVLEAVHRLQAQLSALEGALSAEDDAALSALLAAARERYTDLTQ